MAESQPIVSIVTVVLNNRAYIGDTIRSVGAQTYSPIQHVVVDGGSTDGTVDVIRAHESHFTAWISEPDCGIADAFNKGLARTNGDYILFLNADDWLADSEAIASAMETAVESKYPEIIFGDCDIVDRNTGRHLRRVSMKWSPTAFRFGRMVNHPAMFTHRSYFEKYGIFDTSYRIAMDFELLLRGVFRSRVVHLPRVLTNMRSGGLSMRNRDAAVGDIIRALKKHGVIRTRCGELCFQGYFALRGVLHPLRRRASRLLERR